MKKRPFDTFRTVLSGVRIPWILLLISIVSSFLMANALISTAVITANVVDAKGNLKTEDLIEYATLLLGSGLLAALGNFCNNLLTQKINLGVRTKLWKKLLRLPLSYYDGESGETLVSRITMDCNRASAFLGVIIMAISSLYGLYLAVKNMLSFSLVLTAWSAILVPVVAIGVALSGKLVFRAQSRVYQTNSEATAYLLERVKNLRLVRTSNMVEEESGVGRGKFQSMYRAAISSMLSDNLMASFIAITPIALIVITFIVGSIYVANGQLSLGKVIGFYSVSSLASIRISALITVYGDLTAANGTFDKISSILKTQEEPAGGIPMDVPDADIRVENVSFSYGEKQVFTDLNCTIPQGKVTAIIGENGSGKTTLFKLIERMYEPSSGVIRFGERNIADFDPVSWREAFALVSQDRPLLSGTLRENITYGCARQVTQEELEQVARQSGIWELICTLPEGFDTRVEANGGNFSGGQRQCIAIARAIMRNPDYLLLDEATSNLDAKSEQEVSAALNNLMKGRTTVMIAHSISAISHADYIIALKDGKVEGCGTSEEMSRTSQVFREFVRSQCLPQEDGE